MKNYNSYQSHKQPKINTKNGITCERRQVNFVKPFVYYVLQILLLVPVFGIIDLSFNPMKWSGICYVISAGWILYATKHLFRVLARQKFQAAVQCKKR
jgi:FtsH-binding integral membrane protein